MISILSQLKDLIRHSYTNDCFDFRAATVAGIIDSVDMWQIEWLIIFKQILNRIKKGQGDTDATNIDGKYISLPITKTKKNMVLFFKQKPNNRYDIYHFKIISQ